MDSEKKKTLRTGTMLLGWGMLLDRKDMFVDSDPYTEERRK